MFNKQEKQTKEKTMNQINSSTKTKKYKHLNARETR